MASGGKDHCGECSKPVRDTDHGICCDACAVWLHAGCAKVGKEVYQFLKKNEDLLWYCRQCKPQVKTAMKENVKLRKEMEGLKREMNEFKGKTVNEVKQELKQDIVKELRDMKRELKEELKPISTQTPPDVNQMKEFIDDYMKEKEDIDRRRNNVVIYNIPESDKQNGKDRQEDDSIVCQGLLENSLGITQDEARIQKVVRLGKTPSQGRNRPILLMLRDEGEKYAILRNAKNLKNERDPAIRKIGISPDLTKKQRAHEFELRQELRRRRDEGETGLYIKNGQLHRAREGAGRQWH